MSHDWSTILLAEGSLTGEHRLLGFAIFWLVHDELHILNVATSPDHRRRGVARAVLQAALDLYKAFGFRPVGIRPNYYVDEGEDAIVMVLDL